MFALVDGNNFYVSCERAFQPRLNGRPVVVLSNNDGSIISRSAEVKALGVAMGVPYFQVRPLLEAHHVQVFSSNYALYGDMSRRMMSYLASQVPEVEVYSIDECFLGLHGMERWLGNLQELGHRLREEVLRRTHIPTCIGIAPTKTLAKLANRLAKKRPELGGVLYLDCDAKREWALAQVAVGDVWGIGRQYAAKLHTLGVRTAADLAGCSDVFARKHLGGVVGARLVRELQGQPCLELAPSEDGSLARQSIACSRSFAQPLTTYPEILSMVGLFTSRVAEKLRRQGSAANVLTVFLQKNRFGSEPPPHTFTTTLTLPVPTADTGELLRYVRAALKRIWQPGTVYKKAGVVVDALEPAGSTQLHLFEANPQADRRAKLLQALDQLNERYGASTVHFATACQQPGQKLSVAVGKAERRTPAYTTSWEELWCINLNPVLPNVYR